ncbi:MAG: hypothetical protein ONB05_06380 [candidate division KSB1 bacterium]|nr:hypothetical protein [candidate division KSB1 bacterium]
MKKTSLLILLVFTVCQSSLAGLSVRIQSLSGEVKVRRGLEETWHPAALGMLLEEIDTILTGEKAEVVLKLNDGSTFTLGSNAILDIGDLRKITERELFLYLMSKKIDKIQPRPQKTRLRIGNVSVVHGELKAESPGDNLKLDDLRVQEINGARALYLQNYYPNAIVKLHKILEKYPLEDDCGEIHFYLGKSFEAMDKVGQALDAYQVVVSRYQEQGCENGEAKKRFNEAQKAIERLKGIEE